MTHSFLWDRKNREAAARGGEPATLRLHLAEPDATTMACPAPSEDQAVTAPRGVEVVDLFHDGTAIVDFRVPDGAWKC